MKKLIFALILMGCAKNDPTPVTSVVFSFANQVGTCDVNYSYAGTKVNKSFPSTSREWWSEAYIMQPGDSVSISAKSSTPTARVTVTVLVNGKETFTTTSFNGGQATVKGRL